MNRKMILRILGLVLLCLAALMLLPLLVGLYYRENITAFALCSAATAVVGLCLSQIRPPVSELYARDGFIAVSLSWILMSLIGCLPYYFSGDIPCFTDALFESVSGFTTTGATVLDDVEALSKSCMFWRLFSQWIGGMGVLVFMIAVMPMSGNHSMHIMRAEFPGPTVGKLVPRARQTAMILYIIYIALTILDMLFLRIGGMSWYDACVHAFATAGTGGFSTRNASLGAFNSLYIETVSAVFVLLFSVNFHIYFLILAGRAAIALKNEELQWFICIVLFSVITIGSNLSEYYGSFLSGLRHAFFNVSMSISTSSFNTVDYTLWPQYSQWMLTLLMLIGGCAGSTCGGLKLSRFMILIKNAYADIQSMVHPRSVNPIMIGRQRVRSETVRAIQTYFSVYIMVILFCTLLVATDGFDAATNFSSALACLSNIGPGLGLNGPSGDYSIFSPFVKLVLCFVMLLGRLELYPVLILFTPSTWKK